MQIGELSAITGFSRDTIRWYEKIGLIKIDKKDRYENNYRRYDASTVQKLHQIKRIKGYGFTLNEIKEFMLLDQHDVLTCSSASAIFQNRLQLIEQKIAALEVTRQKLLKLQSECLGYCVNQFS